MEKLHFNLDIETDASKYGKTQPSRNHKVIDDEMVSLENTTVKYQPKQYFQSKVIEFVLGCIPSFDFKFFDMKINKYELPSFPKRIFQHLSH